MTTVIRRVDIMRESSTYQAILREGRKEGRTEGRTEGEHALLLRQARKRLGEPTPALQAKLLSITSTDILEALGERLFEVETWEEWLIEG
jgi:predicted transposase YdaD